MLWIPHQLVGAPLFYNVTLECFTEAHPTSLNYWTREDGHMIHETKKYHMESITNTPTYKTHMKLTISNIQNSDYGTYKCVAKNPRGESDGTIRLYSNCPILFFNTNRNDNPRSVDNITYDQIFPAFSRFTIGNNAALLRSNDIFIVGKNIMAALCGFDGTVLRGWKALIVRRKVTPVSRESSEVYQKIWSRRKREYNKTLWLSYQLKSSWSVVNSILKIELIPDFITASSPPTTSPGPPTAPPTPPPAPPDTHDNTILGGKHKDTPSSDKGEFFYHIPRYIYIRITRNPFSEHTQKPT